jgi:4-hydroxy-tetrahydrodipicolinate reductase
MKTIKVMVNGMPGNMAVGVASHVLADERFELVPYSLTGPDIDLSTCTVNAFEVKLIPPGGRNEAIKNVMTEASPFITVDYTHPTAVNANAEFYCTLGLPFVMGTTGGERSRLLETVSAAGLPAVIAPNMAKQIVGLQAMLSYGAENFPGLFNGYSLEVRESHQKGKADTSGTAKAIVGYFNAMGTPFSEEEIQMERDPEKQKKEWRIPEAHLTGHAWHTYTLRSEDGTVLFSFTHNVNGREVYMKGSLDAVAFLAKKMADGVEARVYSMIDVLKGI